MGSHCYPANRVLEVPVGVIVRLRDLLLGPIGGGLLRERDDARPAPLFSAVAARTSL
jgi:hypothetical protein